MSGISIKDRLIPETNSGKISLFVLCAWILYLVLSPFYVFPKGRPQPADFILMLGMMPVLMTQFLKPNTKIRTAYLIGGLFVVLTMCVNVANYFFFPDIRFLLTMLIYPYNFLVFIFVVWLFQQDLQTAKKWTYYGLAITIGIQILFLIFSDFGFRGYRATAGFENPNQLAYWVLLTATMIVFLKRGKTLNGKDWILLGLLTYMQALALSKAGIITFFAFLLLLFFTPKISKIGYFLALLGILASLFYAMYNYDALTRALDNIEPLKNVIARIEGIGTEADDSPEARGYYRIAEYPLYTIFGSGEGAFYRFNAEGYNRELHSGIATIIFSYGVFGSFLFFTFLTLLVYKQPWYYVLLFLPVIIFGLPHQNFRFSHFWVFLGINYGVFLAYCRAEYAAKMQKMDGDRLT